MARSRLFLIVRLFALLLAAAGLWQWRAHERDELEEAGGECLLGGVVERRLLLSGVAFWAADVALQ